MITTTVTQILIKEPTPGPEITVQSSDANLTYAWTTKSGPAALIFAPSNVLKPIISATVDGTYVALLTVSDSSGATATKEFTIIWDTSPPVIVMPADLSVTGPVRIAGATVTDADPNVTLTWRLILPTTGLTFDNSSQLEPTATPTKDGVFVLELNAKDSLGHSSSGYMNLERYTVPTGSGPVITIGPSLVTKVPAKPPGVNVTSSSDPITYAWTTTSGPANLIFTNSTDMIPTISAPQDGVYIATITATDAQKRSASRSLIVVWDSQAPNVTLNSPLNISRPTQPNATASDASWRLTYSWEQLAGPGTLNFSNTDILSPFISANTNGAYTAQLNVTDSAGNRTSKTLIVNWTNPDTTAPVITLGNPLTIYTPTTPTGTNITDNDNQITIKWDQISGPGTLTFNTPNILLPLISASQVGDYIARITATDSSGNRGEAFLRISWTSGDLTPPVITMPSAMTISQPTAPNPVTVTDASPMTLRWSQVSGPGTLLFSNMSIPMPFISATAAGTYVARLTATDNAGNSSFKDMVVSWVVPDRDSPVVAMGETIRTSFPVQPLGVTVTDQDTQLAYSWSQVTGPGQLNFSNNAVIHPTISASTPGTYVATLTAKDSQGNTGTGILVFTWFIADQSNPVLTMGPNLRISQPVQLTQVKATDNDPNLTYAWQKISGPGTVTFTASNQLSPTISMNQDGTYVIGVTVKDSAGNQASGTLTVVWDKTAPVVYAGADRTARGSFTIQDSSVTDISPVTLNWHIISKPVNASVTFSDIGTLHPLITANYPGAYVFELTATDALGFSASSRMKLTLDIGFWVPTSSVNCSKVCVDKGKTNGRSPEGARCVSGENVVASAVPWVTFSFGCWPNCKPNNTTDTSSYAGNCYATGQKRDNDKTDNTVGCFCI